MTNQTAAELLCVQDTPGMTAPLPWRVFRLTDYEWWVARTLDEAKADAAKEWGYTVEEAERDEMFDEPHELSDAELENTKFQEYMDVATKRTCTFREELDRMIAAGLSEPGFFAGMEG